MCGVAGIFNYAEPDRPIDGALLRRMTRRLEHRGPDGEGFYIEPGLGLGHCRLAIVDLSPAGQQPMQTIDGQFCISYNGELYNHAGFRTRLETRGHRFRGSSDTETLLALLSEYGPAALADAAGIFAFALWDRRARRLVLGRDQMGVKQLYYWDDGRRILFASEIKALLECADVPRQIDAEGLNEYLHFHTPLFDRTFFAAIKQVRAGEFIEVNAAGLRRYHYATADGFAPREERVEETVLALKTLLTDVVGSQLMSDVPVGAFFSGGIDSSAIAAFAKRNGTPISRCFGVHFCAAGVIDERPYQEAAAKALGLRLELTTVRSDSFPDDFLRLAWFQDQPVIGSAMIPMYHVSKLAAGHVKVCLGGQAADEVFGGYARYALARPTQVVSSMFAPRQATDMSSAGVGGNLLKQLGDVRNLRRLARRLRPMESWSKRYFENFAQVPERCWRGAFPDADVVSRARARGTFEAVIGRSPAATPGDKLLHWDQQTYLTGLFQQDDRMSMAHSLESRVPFADPRIVNFALRTGFDLKLRSGATKWILRQAVADAIPGDVLNRRKSGFDNPVEQWMRGPHFGFVRDLLTSSLAASRGWWDNGAVAKIVDNLGSPHWFQMVWKLANIEAWALSFQRSQEMATDRELARESA